MIDSDTENKIVDFIKRSPIGVTSSEIARYFNLSRITVTKYLAIIREKNLIDFKNLGMAKMWYIPAEINRESFLTNILLNITFTLDSDTASTVSRKAGIEIGKKVDNAYRVFYNTEKLNTEQFSEAIIDVSKKIGANFSIIEKSKEIIRFNNTKSPFGPIPNPSLSSVLAGMLGTIAARNFGYAKVVQKKSIAKGDEYDDFVVFMKKSEESDKEVTTEYLPV